MTTAQQILTIAMVVLGTLATRFLPFLLCYRVNQERYSCGNLFQMPSVLHRTAENCSGSWTY